MADDGGGGCVRCCCSFIFTSGLTALFLWLSLRTYKPTCSIEEFYVPALNKTNNSTAAPSNHTIYFNLKLQNQMKDKGVRYANISLAFYYNSTLVANYTVPAFDQGHGKKTHRKDVVEAGGMPWAAAYAAVSNGSSVSFRVKLATRVRPKIMFWYSNRRGLVVAGDVAVDGSGAGGKLNKIKKKAIKLKSGVPDPSSRWVIMGIDMVFTIFIIFLL